MIGFTGTQIGMTERQIFIFRQFISHYSGRPDSVFHHGDCVGADVQATAIAKWMGFRVICHSPINETKRGYFPSDEFREPKEYLARNHDIVDECQLLLATPKEMEEVIRSGTWATIRYARKQHKQIKIIFPE